MAPRLSTTVPHGCLSMCAKPPAGRSKAKRKRSSTASFRFGPSRQFRCRSARAALVNGFDQREAAHAIKPIADRAGVGFDGTDEILQYRLMRPMVADDRGR